MQLINPCALSHLIACAPVGTLLAIEMVIHRGTQDSAAYFSTIYRSPRVDGATLLVVGSLTIGNGIKARR